MFTILQTSFLLPTSFAERLALEDEIRISATLEDYLEFSEQAEYKVEYSNGHIVSMGQASDSHENIIFNLIAVLGKILPDDGNYRGYGSNLGIFIPETEAHYLPDASILDADPEFILHKVNKKTFKSVLNPLAVIEVFSDGTWDYDMTEKLPNYKLCASLHYIIYLHQHKPFATIHTRTEQGWVSTDCMGLDSSFTFEGMEILLKNIYRKVIFTGRNGKNNK